MLRVYSDDHQPAHVHVFRGDAEIRVSLRGDRFPELLSGRMNAQDLRRALAVVAENREQLLEFWMRYHK